MSFSTPKPLQYDSLKIVLLYINANIRLQVSVHMPSLQKTEKLVPLKIIELVLKEYGLSVDGYNYEIVLKRVGRGGPVFEDVNGDLDRYGFQVSLPSRVLTPGDILLCPHGLQEESVRLVDESKKSERYWPFIERELKLINLKMKLTQNPEQYRNELNNALRWLAPFENLRNNKSHTDNCYTQLTVSAQNSVKGVYRAKYTSPLFQGMKYLTTKFFENREPIHVNHLSFEGWVSRLPVGVKFRVQQFKTHYMFVLQESLPPILVGDIENLILDLCNGHPEDFKSKIVQNASRLTISRTIFTGTGASWSSALQPLRNKTIILNVGRHENFKTLDMIRLVNHWIEDGREVGTRFEARSKQRTFSERIFENLKKEFAGYLNNGSWIIVPMVDQTSIVIQYKEIDKDEHGNLFSIIMESVENVDL